MNYKSTPQSRPKNDKYFTSLNRSIKLLILLFVSGLMLTIISGCTPAIIEAAIQNDITEVQSLLNDGVDINTKGPDGTTALHEAAFRGHKDLMELLLTRGADVNARSNNGVTPLYTACRKENTDIVNLLLQNGADVNAECGKYATPLFQACSSGHLEVVNLLLENGAEVNIDPVKWDTPLYIASGNGHEEIVHVLVEKGADINAQNKHSRTALHAAARNGHQEIADYLIRQGAKLNIVEKDLGDIYATAIIYELSAKHYAEKENREKIIEHLEPAAKYFQKASQGYKRAADTIGREIRAAESALISDTRQAWARVLNRDRRNSPTRFSQPPSPPVRRYSRDEMIALRQKHKSLIQRSNFCDKRAAVCNQVLKCCRDAKSETDLKECIKDL